MVTRRGKVAGGAVVVGRTWTLNSQKSSITTSLVPLRRSSAVPVYDVSRLVSNGVAGDVGPPPTAPNSGKPGSDAAG